MSVPSITTMLADVLLYADELSEHDRDIIQMIESANEAGETISQRNYSRLVAMHSKIKGELSHD